MDVIIWGNCGQYPSVSIDANIGEETRAASSCSTLGVRHVEPRQAGPTA